MVKKRLRDYVGSMLSQGYPQDYLRDKLLQSGYSQKEINQAIQETYKPPHHLSKLALPIIALSILIIGIIAFFFFSSPSSQQTTFQILSSSQESTPGGQISFIREISYSGSDETIILKYELLSKETNEVIVVDNERVSTSNIQNQEISLDIPSTTSQGDFILRGILTHSAGRLIDSKDIKLVSSLQGSCSDNIKNQDETDIDCGGSCQPCIISTTTTTLPDSTTTTIPATQIEDVDTSSPFKALQIIRSQASQNPGKALDNCGDFQEQSFRDNCIKNVAEVSETTDYCRRISNNRIKDECFESVAISKKQDSICENIDSDRIRDNCYTAFFLDLKDFSVCFKIKDEKLKENCELFRDIN
tara:strand:- start:5195 stop:6271 length:1077 start_codon:yes stop_codon:yes gene_type:complete